MNHESLSEVFRTHQRSLWGLSYRLTGCAADADEIVQEAFVRALERAASADDPHGKPWLTRGAVNLGVDLLRRRKRTAYTGSWLPSPIETEQAQYTAAADECPQARWSAMESMTYAFPCRAARSARETMPLCAAAARGPGRAGAHGRGQGVAAPEPAMAGRHARDPLRAQ